VPHASSREERCGARSRTCPPLTAGCGNGRNRADVSKETAEIQTRLET
jgi:hypothetical protein